MQTNDAAALRENKHQFPFDVELNNICESLALSHGVNPAIYTEGVRKNLPLITDEFRIYRRDCAKKLLIELHKLIPDYVPLSAKAIDEEARLLFPSLYCTYSDKEMASYIKSGACDYDRHHAQTYIAQRQSGKSIKQALSDTFDTPTMERSFWYRYGAILAAAGAVAVGLSALKSCQAGTPNHPATAHLITSQKVPAPSHLQNHQHSL